MPATAKIQLQTRQVGPWQMNSYALICPETNQSVLIDPGGDPEILMEMLGDSQPIAILLTHTHGDHVGALEEMVDRLNLPIFAHEAPHLIPLNKARSLRHGDVVEVGKHRLRVYHTPGHIDDQICFAVEDDVINIVGDTIFAGGPGKTWSSEGFRTSLHTLQFVVLAWQDDMICYPGHGPHFRLGDKRASIEAFIKRDHGDFFGDAVWD